VAAVTRPLPQHLSLPVRVGADGSFTTLTQGSPAEIGQAVRVLLSTVRGTRRALPAYGVPDITFTASIGPNAPMEQAVSRWEPRATGSRVTVGIAGNGEATIRVTIPEVNR
jgi:phage baseplate assembly protein W